MTIKIADLTRMMGDAHETMRWSMDVDDLRMLAAGIWAFDFILRGKASRRTPVAFSSHFTRSRTWRPCKYCGRDTPARLLGRPTHVGCARYPVVHDHVRHSGEPNRHERRRRGLPRPDKRRLVYVP